MRIQLIFVLISTISCFHSNTINAILHEVPGSECSRDCDNDISFHCIFNWKIKSIEIDSELCLVDPEFCFGDGISRQVTVIEDLDDKMNFGGAIPAPTIRVCYGDRVSVNVINDLQVLNTTVHWHGLHMKQGGEMDHPTQWSDGVPYVTQCPILPKVNYTWYSFDAIPAGTHWYHSHSEFQRDDGVYGALIVKEQTNHLVLNDSDICMSKTIKDILEGICDFEEHHIIITDWYQDKAEFRFITNPTTPPRSILVNGKGRADYDSTVIPWPVFTVDPLKDGCKKYRFRLISSANQQCPLQVSVQNHSMTAIATDGGYIEPIEDVFTIGISNGERFDFVIDTEEKAYATYKITITASIGPDSACNGLAALAFLRYGTSSIDQTVQPNIIEALNVPGRFLNPVPTILPLPIFQSAVCVTELKSIYPLLHKERMADKTFYLQLGDTERVGGAHINNIQFDIKTLGSPLLSQEEDINKTMICDESYLVDAKLCDSKEDSHGCKCHNIVNIEIGDVVEVFLINPHADKDIPHPIHFHGYWHNVIGSGDILSNDPLTYIKMANENGEIPRNLEYPPTKDTITTIPGGYVLTRFYADHPGYWIMHCHMSFDQIEGQDMIFKVGNREDWTMPENFPKC